MKFVSVLCTILLLWGAVVTLAAVLFNIGLGFFSTDTDFRDAFIETTYRQYEEQLKTYSRIAVSSQYSRTALKPSILEVGRTFQSRFSSEKTNLRFQLTDTDGELLLTNEPFPDDPSPASVSYVDSFPVTLSTQTYTVRKHFDVSSGSGISELLGQNMAQYLENPSEFDVWYFTDPLVDTAYHSGMKATVSSSGKQLTDYLRFPTPKAAQNFDYSSVYGDFCEWEVVNGTDEEETAKEKAHDPTGSSDGSVSAYMPVYVRVTATAGIAEITVSLEEYLNRKEAGEHIVPADSNLEKALSSGLDITLKGHKSEEMDTLLRVYLPDEMPVRDTIRANYHVFRFMFEHSEHFFVMMFVFTVLTVVCAISMCSAAGYADNTGVPRPSRVHALPYEFFWLLPVLSVLVSLALMSVLFSIDPAYRLIVICGVGMTLFISACCTLWLYTTAVRIKCGTFWSSFYLVRSLRALAGMLRSSFAVGTVLTVWLALLCGGNIYAFGRRREELWLLCLLLDLLTLFVLLYCIYAYFELHRHVRQMQKGDFTPAQHRLPLGADFRKFDSSLNDITASVEQIVAQQTKAEHLRTELITNVSHDLKTPLTSIVNYVDLLSREPAGSAAAAEYIDVLRRQAARLKKLTLDLVDASKASSGSLTVELMPTELQVLISQLSGEYEDRFAERQLSLVCSLPDEPLRILADGRQIWRVFDNLLGNACKYAMPGTRVYLDLAADDTAVTVTLKNISASPLNVSADELMERFVRGDSSRHTEGSGLGLSIARDLTALQNGTLTLATDGDLFKAVLRFPRWYPPADGAPAE